MLNSFFQHLVILIALIKFCIHTYCTKGFNSDIERCFNEHSAIYDAIKNKDSELAKRLTIEHLDRLLNYTRILKETEIIFV